MHGLLFVKVRVAKGGQSNQPVTGRRCQMFLLYVQPVAADDGERQLLKVLGGESAGWLGFPGGGEIGC